MSRSAGKEDRTDDEVWEKFQTLCGELNMDKETADTAWANYEEIKQHYTLEGNQIHWLACALFVACHNLMLTTVNKRGVVEGNGVSLTRLLRSCKLSLIQFFSKAKKLADMSNTRSPFRHKIESLERNFAVSTVIFKKYQEIFALIFKDPAKDPPKAPRSRKQKKPPCTPGEIFDFCWCLFIRIKADFQAISDDLVNSYHLLLCCVDFVYGNAVVAKRADLISETFEESLGRNVEEDVTELPCIVDTLCRVHDGILNEVKSIREHWWKPHIRRFFEQKILRGDQTTLSGILDPVNFETNVKSIRRDYETHVLSIGEYDERVFLGDDANEEIGTPTKLGRVHGSDISEMVEVRRNMSTQFDGSSLIPNTPLSGRHFLQAKEQLKITPVSTATYLVSRLNSLLGKREAEAGPQLAELFQSCDPNPSEAIEARVKAMGDKFCSHYTAPCGGHPGSHDSFTRMRLKMGVTLYYKLLEAILLKERSQNKPLTNLLEQDTFHHVLFTCCLEIVIFSYNSQRTFPWILQTFDLEPFDFYKVIEIIIRTEDSLPRDVVKHLQRIEEQILESRAWTSDSPLWPEIARVEQVPTCEDVSLPGQNLPRVNEGSQLTQSPISHHKGHFIVKSPMAGDRFKSPVIAAAARRQLSFGEATNQIAPTSPIRSGSLLTSPQNTVIKIAGQGIPLASVRAGGNSKAVSQNQDGDSSTSGSQKRPKKSGSLALFFRKVYHLAHLRLDALCLALQLNDEDVKRKIWTVFEHSISQHTDLMRDRHLDQLIMCSLFVACKVVKQDRTFKDILEMYRNQPQCASHVYRSVLLGKLSAETPKREDEDKNGSVDAPQTPTKRAGLTTVVGDEERGHLVDFYNEVFLIRLKSFSLKFIKGRATDAPPLSPLPKLRAPQHSPCRKISENHSVYIRPLKSTPGDVVTSNPHSPHKPLSYSFCRSPSKNLQAINELMRTEIERKSAKKRLLEDSSDPSVTTTFLVHNSDVQEPPVKMHLIGKAVNSKLGIVFEDRSQP